MKRVVVLDYGSGNIRSAVRMLERIGANVELTADPKLVAAADGLFVPGVGNFHACMAGLEAAGGRRLIDDRLAAGAPVLGVCVGMQVMFDGSDEPSGAQPPQQGQFTASGPQLADNGMGQSGAPSSGSAPFWAR